MHNDTQHNAEHCYGECPVMLRVIYVNCDIPYMLSVVMMNVVMLSVIIQNVVAPIKNPSVLSLQN